VAIGKDVSFHYDVFPDNALDREPASIDFWTYTFDGYATSNVHLWPFHWSKVLRGRKTRPFHVILLRCRNANYSAHLFKDTPLNTSYQVLLAHLRSTELPLYDGLKAGKISGEQYSVTIYANRDGAPVSLQ